MKKCLKSILLFTILFVLLTLGMKVYAQDAEDNYLITQENGVYSLYSSKSGDAPLKVSESFSELLDEIKGVKTELDGIRVDEPVYLSDGNYALCGTARMSSVLEIQSGASLFLDGAEICFSGSNSYIRVKGGELTVKESFVASESREGVLLDYAYSSKLTLESGKIYAARDCAIKLYSGCANILGGEVLSESCSAIDNKATLTVAGSPTVRGYVYDVTTDFPINLSYGKIYFSSEIKVCFSSDFKKGTLTEIFRACNEESLSGCRLFNAFGVEQTVQYFEESRYVSEKSFAAVFLPYTVRLFDCGRLISTLYYLDGEEVGQIEAPEKFGYDFSAWYKDEEKTQKLSASEKTSGDIDIYASYALKKIKFVLLSESFVYDGSERVLSFTELSHPLSEKGRFGFEWYKDGEPVGNYDGGVPLKNVSDSGLYSCKVTFYYEKDSVSVTTPPVSVTVEKKSVDIPKIPSVKYNGSFQYSGCKSTDLFTVTDSGGVDAGTYLISLRLRDAENYTFNGAEGVEAFSEFLIEKAENYWTSPLCVKDTYLNVAPTPLAYAAFGDVSFSYFSYLDSKESEAPQSKVGEYYVVARVMGNDNYSSLESEPVKFSVLEERVIALSVISPPERVEYYAFETLDARGITLKALYNSDREELLTERDITVEYQEADSFRFGDTAVNIVFSGVVTTISVNVKKASYDLSGIEFSDSVFVYDGSYHSISYFGKLPVGEDNHPLCAIVSQGGTDAGAYTIRLSFESESKNYVIPEEMLATLTILPRTVEVEWGETEFLYDGTLKNPTASFVDAYGKKTVLDVYGGADFAGEGFEAFVKSPSANYVFSNPKASFTVEKADYDFSSIEWSFDSVVYNGKMQTLTVAKLPSGVEVIGYTDNSAVNAGKYKATAVLKYDERNYNPPGEVVFEWEILPAEYDMSGFYVEDAVFQYDGEAHYPNVVGNMPIGYDGIALEYELLGSARHVDDGICKIEIKFSSKSKNYVLPDSIFAAVEIIPMPIYVEWSYDAAVFDGESHVPSASSEYCEIVVSGAEAVAGLHVAEAVASSSDYSVINGRYEFLIAQAENSWEVYPSIENLFEGDEPSPKGKAKDGEVEFFYFEDRDCTKEVKFPLAAGKYYMKAFVLTSENYLCLESEAIEFEVLEVFAIGIIFNLNGDSLTAFSKLSSSDFSAIALYNNGSEKPINQEYVNISYQNGDTFRCSDEYLTAEWNGFSVQVPVTVQKAIYDISGVRWDKTEQEYDGQEKLPSLLGLPEGVTVKEYIGGGVKHGEYEVFALLEYDSENYEEPEIEPCVMTILKQTVAKPILETVTYNGENLAPVSPSPLYHFEVSSFVDAGEYTVRAVLNDVENYTFDDGESTSVTFKIAKKNIEISVGDIELYKYDEPYFPSYSSNANHRELEALGIYFVADGDHIYLRTDDPNHEIICTPGKIIRHDRLSPEKITLITALSILFALILLAALPALIYRRKILSLLAALRCRRAFATGRVLDPIPFPLSLDGAEAEHVENKKEDEAQTEISEKDNDDISLKALSAEEDLVITVDVEHADSLITDSLAKNLIRDERDTVFTDGYAKNVVNVDTLSQAFNPGDCVDVNAMKEHRLVARDTAYVKVLARGSIDKPLSVRANAFSLAAVKMIALCGGEAIKVSTVRKRDEKKKGFRKDY